jgi:hypothetical protein
VTIEAATFRLIDYNSVRHLPTELVTL